MSFHKAATPSDLDFLFILASVFSNKSSQYGKRTSKGYGHRTFCLLVATIIAEPVFLIEVLVINSYSTTIDIMFRSRMLFQYDASELHLLTSTPTFFIEEEN